MNSPDVYNLCRNILIKESVSQETRELAFKVLTSSHLTSDKITVTVGGIQASFNSLLVADIKEKMLRGDKIQAIKRLREETGYGLKESKDFIDYFYANPGVLNGFK